MELNLLQNLLNTSALKELPKFTGDPDQKVTQFINAVEHIGSFAGLNESMLHSIAIIKLGESAFSWYDNNKEDLKSWQDLKQHIHLKCCCNWYCHHYSPRDYILHISPPSSNYLSSSTSRSSSI